MTDSTGAANNDGKMSEFTSVDNIKVKEVQPVKAYKNLDFLNSREARHIRIICEFEDSMKRLREQGVKETIMVFGSARARSTAQWKEAMTNADAALKSANTDEDKAKVEETIRRLKAGEWMTKIVDSTVELSKKLTEWAMTYESSPSVGGGALTSSHPSKKQKVANGAAVDSGFKQSIFVCTGGGPGLMEAANRGADMVPGARSIGMGISLPFEAGLNPYVSEELAFEYHYFFTRKYWMLYPCRALVCTPGGFGTMDELFELLTLKQTKKIKVNIPIVLFGASYWKDVIQFDKLVKYGTISQSDYDSLFFTDSVDDAFKYITTEIIRLRDQEKDKETI